MVNTKRDTDFGPETSGNSLPSLRRLRAAGDPITLTINGKVHVVKDDKSFEELLDLVDRLETLEGIGAGIDEMKAGRGRPMEEVFEDIYVRHSAQGPLTP